MSRTRRAVIIAFAGALLVGTVCYLASAGAIEIVAAEYGVPGRICAAGPEIKKHASDVCRGFRPRCLISVGSGWCGDPAPGVRKTLTVDYTCGDTRKRASAADGSGLVLSCP